MDRDRRGGAEAWVLVGVALLILVGGAAGLYVWGRMVSSRLSAEAASAQSAAAKNAVQATRDAEREARGDEEPKVGAAAGTGPAEEGRAVELARLIARAVDSADTPGRREDAKRLVDGAAMELDSGRLKDGPGALSTLRMAIGGGYRALGDPARAVGYLKAAAEERTERLGDRDPDAVRARMELEDAQRAAAEGARGASGAR